MFISENQNTVRTSGKGWHENLKTWETGQVGIVLDDHIVHETPEMLEAHTGCPSLELEREVGHAMLAGDMSAEQAYEALRAL